MVLKRRDTAERMGRGSAVPEVQYRSVRTRRVTQRGGGPVQGPPVAAFPETPHAARQHPAARGLIKQQEITRLSPAVSDTLIAGASFIAAATPA